MLLAAGVGMDPSLLRPSLPAYVVAPAGASSGATGGSQAEADGYLGTEADTPSLATTFGAANYETNLDTNNTFYIPPDPHGAVGPNHVLNVVNVTIEWYSKQGQQQQSLALQDFFEPLGAVNYLFDPKVIFDEHAGRFVVVALERTDVQFGDATDSSRILVAVSDDSNPNGGWRYQAINSKLVIDGLNRWVDHPGLAVDEEGLYITGNMWAFQSNNGQWGGSRLWTLPKGVGTGGLYDGGSAAVNVFDPSTRAGNGWNYFTLQPTHVRGSGGNGATDGVWLVSSDLFFDNFVNEGLAVIRIQNGLSPNAAFTRWNLFLGDLSSTISPPDAPQLGTSTMIEAGDLRMRDAEWRNGTIYAVNQIVPNSGPDAGQVTAHWYKISVQGASPVVQDQGDIGAEDLAAGTHTYYPSVTVDAENNVAFGFNASGPNLYLGAYYTHRAAADAAGTVQSTGTLKAGEDYYNRKFGGSVNYWGHYSAIDLDPVSATTFWVYNSYAMLRGAEFGGEDGRWATQWGRFYLNAPPTVALTDVVTDLAEDADTTAGLKVATIVVGDDDGSYELALTGEDQALFELRDLELWLKPGAVLDFETNSTLSVVVEIDDPAVGADPDGAAPLSIGISDVNEPPQIDLVPTVTSLAENADTSVAVKVADIVITDDTVVSRTIWLSGPDSATFKIVGSALYLKPGSLLDHAANPSLDVTININDAALGGSPDDTDSLTITVTGAGDAPTGIDLSANAVAENQPAGTTIGTLTSSDPDVGETFTYAAASGPGDDDNAAFAIAADTGEVTTAASFDFESDSSLSFRVRTTDAGGLWFERSFAVSVSNVNDAPQISFDNEVVELPEDTDTSSPIPVADIVISDDALGSQSYYILGGLNDDSSLFGIDSATGKLILRANAALNHETNPVLNITIVVDDPALGSSFENSATLAIAIADANDSPTIEAEGPQGQSVTYFEQGPPVALIEAGIVADEDGSVLAGAMFRAAISVNATADDRLLLSGSNVAVAANGNVLFNGRVIGTLTSNGRGSTPLAVSFNSAATLWSVRKVLQSVRFETLGDNPAEATRQVHLWVTDDAGGSSVELQVAVAVVRVNDAPVLNNSLNPPLRPIWEDAKFPRGTPVSELVQSAMTDVDAGALRGIAVVGAATNNGSWQYRLKGSAVWQTMGAISETSALLLPEDTSTQVRFLPKPNYNGQVWLSYRAWDRTEGRVGQTVSLLSKYGGSHAFSASREGASLQITAINDQPIVQFSSNIGYRRDKPAIVLAPYAQLYDVDSPDFGGAQLRVRITEGASTADRLAIGGVFSVSGNGIILRAGITIGTLNANGGVGAEDLVVSFNTNATKAVVKELLRSVTFRTFQGSVGIRKAVFSLTDGDGGMSPDVTKAINVT
jgi:hypothetical protein